MTQPQNEDTKKYINMFLDELFDRPDSETRERLKTWLDNIEHTGFRKVKIDEGIV